MRRNRSFIVPPGLDLETAQYAVKLNTFCAFSLGCRRRLDVEPDDSPAGLTLPGGHCDVQPMQLGDQDCGLRADGARHLRQFGEVTRVDLRVDPDVTLPARRVHPPVRDVEDFRVDALRCGQTRD